MEWVIGVIALAISAIIALVAKLARNAERVRIEKELADEALEAFRRSEHELNRARTAGDTANRLRDGTF
jgi:hypothetical protein